MDPLPIPAIDPAAPLVQRLSGIPGAPTELVHWHPGLRRLLGYWQGLCAGRPLPRRADLDPAAIGPDILPNLMMLGREAGSGRFVYRLVGTGIVRAREGLRPHDPTGRYVDETPHRMSHDWILAGPSRAAAEKRPIYDSGQYELAADRGGRYERLSLPLSADGETVDRLLVGFFVG
ncbi:MAG: PAS domain-containing protein [Alphaproteobacteria bacterium]|nr:PAS domain-containing protein [Alphaproteobacteria bacterium]